jgi:DNA-binding response OmpR family regulator
MHITRLRQKLTGDSLESPVEWIMTVRGKGYMLAPDIKVDTERQSSEEAW